MNKYKAESKAAQRQRVIDRSCRTKKRYESPFEAPKNGQMIYECPHCKGYHLSGLLKKLAAQGKRFLENRGLKP